MSADCVCRTDREARILRALLRRTQIKNRHLCVPYSTAYEWSPIPPRDLTDEEAEKSRGPTMSERMHLYAEHAGVLAVRSAETALEASSMDAEAVSHLITVSCTGFEAPGVDVQLIDQLGLPATTERIHVGFMGCHGAINGMRAALAVTAADNDARVLVVATELCSLHFCFTWEPERLLGNALFADGSAAFIARSTEDDESVGDDARAGQVVATGSCLFENSRDAITWRIGDYGFEMSLSQEVPELIEANLRPWMAKWLQSHGLSIDEISSWAIHPGGPRIVDAVAESLGLSAEDTNASREILQSYGNMSSPTILFILEKLWSDGKRGPCVALGFGPGLIAEAVLIR